MTGSTATLLAARHSRSEAVLSALLAAAPDTLERASVSGLTPLMAAAQNEHPQIAKLLLTRGADPHRLDREGRSALSWAAGNKNVETLKTLLALPGVKIDQRDERGMTPLMYAVRANNAEAVRLLLARGANADTRSRDGFSAAEMGRNKPELAHFFPAPKRSASRYTAPARSTRRPAAPKRPAPKRPVKKSVKKRR